MRMKNTLYISYDGMTDPLGESQVIPYLKGIAHAGFNIAIISAEKPDAYQKRADKIRRILAASNIDWHPIKYHFKPPLFSTLFDFRKMKRKAFKLHRQKKFDLVHCRSYIPALIGLSLKKKKNVRFLFDMRGFWADERIEGGIWNASNPVFSKIYCFFKKKELDFFSKADYTVSLTHKGKEEIHSWIKIPDQPINIEVIPCCTDFSLFTPNQIDSEKQESYRKELGIQKNDFVLSYLGSIGTWYMLDEMLGFFKTLTERKKQAKFLFITREPEENIQNLSAAKGIDKKQVIVKSAERENVPTMLSLSNLAIFFIKPVFSKKASSPTKQGELMGLGLPLICNSNIGDVDNIVKNNNTGYVIEKFAATNYSKAIDFIDELLQIEKEKIIKSGKDVYDVTIGIEKYVKIYRRLTK